MSLKSKYHRVNNSNSLSNASIRSMMLKSKSAVTHSSESIRHSRKYSELLEIYVNSLYENVRLKLYFKRWFFRITMGILLSILIIFVLVMKYSINTFNNFDHVSDISLESILSTISVVVPAVVSLIVAFIEIPKIIAQYLFNIEEDNNMNAIIKNIQDYDSTMFEMEHKIDRVIEKQANNIIDEEIEDIPEVTNK
ncbi:hypothetical protein [Roseburia porci]|nr:hypothetical protein [Roseburia porci]